LKYPVKLELLFEAGKKSEEKISTLLPSFWQIVQQWHLV
jgi:hypothetical protein